MSMIKSMTGYGKATAVAGVRRITAEVRSLNSKQFDLNLKMPTAYRSLEHQMRVLAAARVGRGKTDMQISVEDPSATSGAHVNAGLFAAYFLQVREAAHSAGIDIGDGRELIPAILRMPEVMSSENAEPADDEAAALIGAVSEALDALDDFRTREGEVLLADISGRVDEIERLLGMVAPFEAARVPAVKARILENVVAAGVTVDANRLEQEIVFWVEKLDITEEKVRLTRHCDYFRETAASNEDGTGRKLGFIAQEMGREINTLGSKANDADIQKLVVRMKDELEKIKEQLLNIL